MKITIKRYPGYWSVRTGKDGRYTFHDTTATKLLSNPAFRGLMHKLDSEVTLCPEDKNYMITAKSEM